MAIGNTNDSGASLVIMMLRSWSSARSAHENPLPDMYAKSAPSGASPEFVVACDSLFTLTEAVLARPLLPARSCSTRLSRDEAALLMLIASSPQTGTVETTTCVPHGLPGALRWAAMSVRRALGDGEDQRVDAGNASPSRHYPFRPVAIDLAA